MPNMTCFMMAKVSLQHMVGMSGDKGGGKMGER